MLLVDFGFRTLGLHRISAVHHPDNVASGRVLQKIGMRFEGRHRDHMYARGTWRDSMAYAILEDEWIRTTRRPRTKRGRALRSARRAGPQAHLRRVGSR